MRALLLATCLGMAAFPAFAETLVVDARTAPAAPIEGYLKTGTLVSPAGHTIGVNERYLTMDGKPWMPVMGEFHYTRYPAEAWEEELLKMKAAGVTIVATYIIWNHHEPQPGEFNWKGDHDLRRFAELVKKHGMLMAARIGPWAHAEARFGGVPDWVVDAMPTRGDDPQYLSYVDRLYGEIGKQLSGLMWKDGGPVVIVQLENEYNLTGPGQGPQHIATLKKMAIAHGFDAPLYTVTGWDHTHYPSDEVAPVFGGYPDEPWNASPTKLSPREPYAFRFGSRTGADLGAQTRSNQLGTADAEGAKTPFLGAEFGGGVPAMYRRRPVIAPDDLGSMVTVQLGSGVNLYGYYMFHGGRNPGLGSDAIQESTGSGGYNDVPRIGYDFQAPLGQYGQVRPVMGTLRPLHLFMEAFGETLAPMTVRVPAVVPKAREDLTTPRFAVRSDGKSGFVFMSNYVRQYPMAAQNDVRFQVDLARGPLTFPSQAVDVPSGAYFIWPFNMDLAGANLAWATAQPVTHLTADGVETYVFFTAGGMPAEFAFEGARSVKASSGKVTREGGRTLVRGSKTGLGEAIGLTAPNGKRVRILLLDKADAGKVSVFRLAGQDRLVLSDDPVFADDQGLDLRSVGETGFRFGVYPALKTAPTGDLALRAAGQDGVFQMFEASAQARAIDIKVTPLRPARTASPLAVGGPPRAALEPMPEQFGRSAAWTIEAPKGALDGVNDVFLRIDYKGDVGRLFSGVRMLDDHYFDGRAWEVGLKRFAAEADKPLTLTVLPLRQDAPIYIEDGYRPQIAQGGQVAEVVSVTAVPEYRLRVRIAP
jgi:hypothetical protein